MTIDRPAKMATQHEMVENVDSAVLKKERANSLEVVSSYIAVLLVCPTKQSDESYYFSMFKGCSLQQYAQYKLMVYLFTITRKLRNP